MENLTVELSTPSGPFFFATASSIDVRTEDGSVHITPREESYLSMTHATEITLQTAEGACVFVLENAVAGLKEGSFTVLAERIHRVEPEAVEEPVSERQGLR
jgi:F0F1-type ATP synthase epsilon subunit